MSQMGTGWMSHHLYSTSSALAGNILYFFLLKLLKQKCDIRAFIKPFYPKRFASISFTHSNTLTHCWQPQNSLACGHVGVN